MRMAFFVGKWVDLKFSSSRNGFSVLLLVLGLSWSLFFPLHSRVMFVLERNVGLRGCRNAEAY